MLFPRWLHDLGYYGLALFFVGAATLLRMWLGDVLVNTPILVFYLAWVGAAAFGGLGPGLLATLVSWACIDLLFDSTPGHVGFSDTLSVHRLIAMLAGGLIVSMVGEKMRQTRIRKRRQGRALAIANAALQELNATLESRVAERTAELQHRAQQLQKLAMELSRAEDRERKRLADILHDDLQQQLAAVKFHLSVMAGRARGDAALQEAVEHITGMLSDAIATSRSLSHELSPTVLYRGDLGETFEWLAGQIRTKHGLDVRVRCDGRIDSDSDGLKAFLYKAGQEMLFNVVKHARVREATMRLRRRGPCICLTVSDRGRGFDPQDLGATAGFGLFNIGERVQLLGGRLKIKSAEGKGSTFFLAVADDAIDAGSGAHPTSVVRPMPGADGEPGARLTPGLRLPTDTHGRTLLRVLVADDHAVVRQGLLAILHEKPGIEVVGEAANGREAVDLAVRLEPDVVIMDVAMPLIDGDRATRQIKGHLPEMRVIALSMHDEPGMVQRMRRAGAEAYVLKTAPSEELLAAVLGPQCKTL